jgi:hypothetical protein
MDAAGVCLRHPRVQLAFGVRLIEFAEALTRQPE